MDKKMDIVLCGMPKYLIINISNTRAGKTSIINVIFKKMNP